MLKNNVKINKNWPFNKTTKTLAHMFIHKFLNIHGVKDREDERVPNGETELLIL